MSSSTEPVRVHVADDALARRIERATRDGLRSARARTEEAAATTNEIAVVHLRTRRRFETLGAGAVTGALVVMRVTQRGARRLPALVDDVRAAGAAGVQIVWDGDVPAREHVEQHVFAVLEKARATPKGPPVVLARSAEPARALRALVAGKRREPHG